MSLLLAFFCLTATTAHGASASHRPAGAPPHAAYSSPNDLPVRTGDPLLDGAERNAIAVLSANQVGDTHRAAPFYVGPWIRDSYAWGMVPDNRGTLGTYATTELAYWLGKQQASGAWITFKYSGWYDETPIFIAAVLDAYRQTGDRAMVRRALPALRRAWNWLDQSYVTPQNGSSCLLWVTIHPDFVPIAADWADQVARTGYTPQLEGLWLRATRALAALELAGGDIKGATPYQQASGCIEHDVNRLLWSTSAPTHLDAPPLAAFGHFRASPSPRDYFEIDGNALLLSLGESNRRDRAKVLGTVMAHASYLLGASGSEPARVLYGDYDPADYAGIHNWMAPGRYQSAYWPSVGGLLALAAARDDHTATAITILRGLARAGTASKGAFYEWYGEDGTANGATTYGWGARMYLLALYRAMLGVDDSPSLADPAGLVLRAAPGPASGEMIRLGLHIYIKGHSSGRFISARVDGKPWRSSKVPARLLHNGTVIDVYRK